MNNFKYVNSKSGVLKVASQQEKIPQSDEKLCLYHSRKICPEKGNTGIFFEHSLTIKDSQMDICKHWEKKEYKHMARGTMYELQREKDFLNQLQEEELYEHLPDIAEFVKTEKNKEGAVCILLEEMQELGAVVGKEDDIPYIIFTKECKENYFRDRFAKVKKMVADMDLDEFSNSDLFTLRDTIQDNWGDMAYEDSMIPFDQFIRTAIPDAKYYIGNIIRLH